jgi:hypothetical protein
MAIRLRPPTLMPRSSATLGWHGAILPHPNKAFETIRSWLVDAGASDGTVNDFGHGLEYLLPRSGRS